MPEISRAPDKLEPGSEAERILKNFKARQKHLAEKERLEKVESEERDDDE